MGVRWRTQSFNPSKVSFASLANLQGKVGPHSLRIPPCGNLVKTLAPKFFTTRSFHSHDFFRAVAVYFAQKRIMKLASNSAAPGPFAFTARPSVGVLHVPQCTTCL